MIILKICEKSVLNLLLLYPRYNKSFLIPKTDIAYSCQFDSMQVDEMHVFFYLQKGCSLFSKANFKVQIIYFLVRWNHWVRSESV